MIHRLFTHKIRSTIFFSFCISKSHFLSACAACGIGLDDKSRVAFILTTAILTFIPLLMGGGFLYYLYFLHKKQEADHGKEVTN